MSSEDSDVFCIITSNSAGYFMIYCLLYFAVLQEATLGSSDEGVCRAARGALWVIKSTTGKSPVKRSGIMPH